jgi:CheY-like chemotaxis protein
MPTILIIEDNKDAARILDLTLRREGYDVIVAPDGFQGLKVAQAQHPNLILLDLMLPGIDGFEVCNKLRANPATADTPIIVVSAKPQEADRQMAAKVGANSYFTKPYKRDDLLAAMQTLLAKEPLAPVAAQGTGVAFVGARDSEAVTNVAVNVALALAHDGAPVTLVDLHPYAVDHCLLLNLAPRPAPVNLAQRETLTTLTGSMVDHPGGLRLLNNLEGSGDGGQIAPADASAVLDALLGGGGHVIVDLPLYPTESLREASARCTWVALVTAFDQVALASAHAALNVMERMGLSSQQIGLVLIGEQDAEGGPDLGRVVLGTLPPAASSDHPSFRTLAARLRNPGSKV